MLQAGHFPGHLRSDFSDAAEVISDHLFRAAALPQSFFSEADEVEKSVREAISRLWNCTDIMPSDLCSTVRDIEEADGSDACIGPGATYARGARAIVAAVDCWP